MPETVQAKTPDFALGDQGELLWQQSTLARLCAGPEVLQPKLHWVDTEPASPDHENIKTKAVEWLNEEIKQRLEPLVSLAAKIESRTMEPPVQSLAQKILDGLGAIDRRKIARDLRDLSQEQRGSLREFGVRFGEFSVFMPVLLRPASSRLLALLMAFGPSGTRQPFFAPPGLTSLPDLPAQTPAVISVVGLRRCGNRLIRLDMLERVGVEIRAAKEAGTKDAFLPTLEMVALLGCTKPDLAGILLGLGYLRDQISKVEDGEIDELASTWKQKPFKLAKQGVSQRPTSPKKKAPKNKKPSAGKKYQAREKKIDPDSPFAVLQSLKLDQNQT